MATAIWRHWLNRAKRLRPTAGGRRNQLQQSGPARARRTCPRLETLEDRTLPSAVIPPTNNLSAGYGGLHFTQSGGFRPPDTCGAAGPTNYVETVNQTIALFAPKGTPVATTTASFNTFLFTTGGLSHPSGSSSLSDPIVTYDDQMGRFIVGDQDVDDSIHVSNFDIAVSKTSNPATLGAADWNFYAVSTTEATYDADYPGNFGYNHDAFVFTLNMFPTVDANFHVLVVSVNSADLAAGVAPASLHVFRNDVADFSLRPTTMHDSVAGDPMWLATEHDVSTSIDVIKMSNVLSNAATFNYTNLAVTPYLPVVAPLNPNGTVITPQIDSRILKAGEWNHTLVATHSVGVSATEDDAQWYAINVTGTPALLDQGRISGGNKTYLTYPGIDINATNQIGMSYMRSGNDTLTDFLSMYVTGRKSTDPAGTMLTSKLVPNGTGLANYADPSPHRAGDLSGINVDPVDGSFWAANEFANTDPRANWGTAIANFALTTQSVTLLRTDAATQGTWQGVYGTDGYDLAQGPVSLPIYAQVALSGQSNFTWNSSTPDPRALLKPPAGSNLDRLAATWFTNTNETLDVTLADGQTHPVALYLLDWDGQGGGRRERIDVVDADTSSVLNSQTVSGFTGGVYLAWSISGHVQFKVTNLGGPSSNAVVSGLFFGQAGVRTDTATKGSWQGSYGTSGETIAAVGGAMPGYIQLGISGAALPFTWAAPTGDVRALQNPTGGGRSATTWYNPGSFSFDVTMIDGQSHPVALYLLDWDNAGRSERVDVTDPSGNVLYTNTVNGFSNGQWLVYTIAGHVTFSVTRLAGPNAVVSGIFFGQPGAPQLAAPGQGQGGRGVPALTEQELAPVLAAAEDRWIATGLSQAEVQELRNVTAVVTDLPAGYVGRAALGGSTIYLDASATGYGWYLDPTPLDDSEFPLVSADGLLAPAGSSAFGRMDLLTVVMHELGHVLNLDSLYSGDPADLMAAYLTTGNRRLPNSTTGLGQSVTAVAAGREVLGESSGVAALPASLVGALGTTGSSSAAETTVPTPGEPAVGFNTWTIPDWWFLSESFGRAKQQPWDTDEVVFAA